MEFVDSKNVSIFLKFVELWLERLNFMALRFNVSME